MPKEHDNQSGFSPARRAFLRGPLDHFRNIGGHSNSPTTNRVVEGIGETISLLGVLAVAWKGSQDQIVTYEVGSESKIKDSPHLGKMEASLSQFRQIVDPVTLQVRNLNDTWQRAYEDTVCQPVTSTSINSQGEPEITTTIECNTEWNEPTELVIAGLDHYKLWGWKNFFGSTSEKVNLLHSQTPESFDLSDEGSSLFYKEKAADTGGQLALAALAYGTIGALFCLYEEAVSSATDNGYSKPFIDDKKYIKRRTLFKLAAATLLAWKIRDFQRAFVGENKELLQKVKENTKEVLGQMNVSPETNFKRFFGTDPRNIRNTLVDIDSRSRAVLASGYNGFLDGDWRIVQAQIRQTQGQAKAATDSFDRYFSFDSRARSYSIPQELTETVKSLWATKEIVKFVQSTSTRIYTRHLSDSLFMALGLGGAALVAEKILFPLSDVLGQRVRE